MHKTETLELSSLNGMKSFIMCCAQQHFEPRMLRAFSVNTVLSFIINVQVKLIISFSVALCRAQGCVRPRQLHRWTIHVIPLHPSVFQMHLKTNYSLNDIHFMHAVKDVESLHRLHIVSLIRTTCHTDSPVKFQVRRNV